MIVGVAVVGVAVVGAGAALTGCEHRGSQSTGGAGTPPASAPAPGAPAPEAAAGGPVTPRTEAPNEARVLSAAFSAVARRCARRWSESTWKSAVRASQKTKRRDQETSPFLKRFFHFGPGMPEPSPGPSAARARAW